MEYYFAELAEDLMILGFDIANNNIEILKAITKQDFVPISQEVYNFCMSNNSMYHTVVTDGLKLKVSTFNENREDYINKVKENFYEKESKNNRAEKIMQIELPSVIQLADLSTEKIYNLAEVIYNRQRKNVGQCGEAITFGIVTELNGERVRFNYEIEDQLNYEEKAKMIKEGILDDTTGIPLKGVGQSEYTFVSVAEFTKIYKELIYNKYYNLFYVRVLNKYIETLTDPIQIEKMTYEVRLPQEYVNELDELLKSYKEYREGDSL